LTQESVTFLLGRGAQRSSGLAVHVGSRLPIDKAPVGLVQVRDVLFARVTELHAFETARTTVERKHLDGVTALFPAAVRDWAGSGRGARRLPLRRFGSPSWTASIHRHQTTRRLSMPAWQSSLPITSSPPRSKAYYEPGDGRRGMSLAIGWLRSKEDRVPETN
jgi:hypothetical protein